MYGCNITNPLEKRCPVSITIEDDANAVVYIVVVVVVIILIKQSKDAFLLIFIEDSLPLLIDRTFLIIWDHDR